MYMDIYQRCLKHFEDWLKKELDKKPRLEIKSNVS